MDTWQKQTQNKPNQTQPVVSLPALSLSKGSNLFQIRPAGKKPATLCPCLTFLFSFASQGPKLLLCRTSLAVSTPPDFASLARSVTSAHSQLLAAFSLINFTFPMTNTCSIHTHPLPLPVNYKCYAVPRLSARKIPLNSSENPRQNQ